MGRPVRYTSVTFQTRGQRRSPLHATSDGPPSPVLRLLFLVLLCSTGALAQRGPEPPITVLSADGGLRATLGGTLHTDARWRSGGEETEAPTAEAFQLRRARLEVGVEAGEAVRVVVKPGFGKGKARLVDGWAEAVVGRGVRIRAGRFKAPFGLESLRSSSALWFAERAFPTALSPRRDLGAMVHGSWSDGRLAAAVGVFNGVPDGGSESGEPSDAKDAVARVTAEPVPGVRLGLAGAVGAERGSPDAPALADYETSADAPIFRYAPGVVADGARQRVGPQLEAEAGRFGLMAETTWARHRMRGTDGSEPLTHHAWQVAASAVLLGPGGPVSGPRTGTVEASARLHGLRLDPDAAAFAHDEAAALRATGWALAVHASPTAAVRLGGTVERTTFPDAETPAETFVVFRIGVGF